MTKIVGVYQIQSKCKPERHYIGSSVDVEKRWKQHLSELKHNRHDSEFMQNHYNKHGQDDLEFSIVMSGTTADLLLRELYVIDMTNPCWNTCKIPTKSCLGVKRTDATRAKLSAALKGLIKSKATRAKLSAAKKGKRVTWGYKHTDETRAKISLSKKGQVMSDEARVKMSVAHKGKSISNETRAKLSAANKGKKFTLGYKHSEETKAKISASMKGKNVKTII